MAPDDSPPTATPEERVSELGRLFRNHDHVDAVSSSADDDGAVVMCYAHLDYVDEIEDLARSSGFDVAHAHEVGDEMYFLFGYAAE